MPVERSRQDGLQSLGNGVFALRGVLDFARVAELWRSAEEQFAEQTPVCIDLAAVSRSDSSGVALLVAWLSAARARNGDLRFINMPAQMQAIVGVADLQDILSDT